MPHIRHQQGYLHCVMVVCISSLFLSAPSNLLQLGPSSPAWMESRTFSLPPLHQQLQFPCPWKTELPVSRSGRLRGTRSRKDIADEEGECWKSRRAVRPQSESQFSRVSVGHGAEVLGFVLVWFFEVVKQIEFGWGLPVPDLLLHIPSYM